MAIGVVKLTYKQRHHLNVVFFVLNSIQVFFGLLIIIASAYAYFRLAPVLYSDKSEVSFVVVVLSLYGLHVIIHYMAGMKISHKCFKQAEKKSTRSLLLAWVCAGGILVLSLILLSALSREIAHHIKRSMIYSFRYGMQNYLQEDKWKQFIDNLQYKLGCCGIDGYEDWHQIGWLNKYQVNENSELAKKFLDPDTKTYSVIPWSCCRVDFPLQCLHDPLQQTSSTQVWENEPTVVTDSLNLDGCLETLDQPIELAINLFVALTAFIFLINFFIFLVARLLYTSCRNALLLNDPEGVAPGWIFGRGDCGYTRGKSVYDIMVGDAKTDKKKTKREQHSEQIVENHMIDHELYEGVEPMLDSWYGLETEPVSERN